MTCADDSRCPVDATVVAPAVHVRMRDLHGPVAASAFAGLLGAGLIDVLVTVARADGPAPFGPLLLLAIGLYGVAGLDRRRRIGGLVQRGARRAARRLAGDPLRRRARPRDRQPASSRRWSAVLVLATAAAVGQRLFVGKMASQKLAAIAFGGHRPAGVTGWRAPSRSGSIPTVARAIAARLPRPGEMGATGLLLLVLLGGGVLGGRLRAVARRLAGARPGTAGRAGARRACSALGHGLFWYRTKRGAALARRFAHRATADRARARWPWSILSLALGARIPESSALWKAVERRLARAALGHHAGARAHRSRRRRVLRALRRRRLRRHPRRRLPGRRRHSRRRHRPELRRRRRGGRRRAGRAGRRQPAAAAPRTAAAAPKTQAAARAGRARRAFKGNILIVTIDAFRGDRLGVAGYGRPPGRSLTPTLDALAKRGAYFRRAWSRRPTRRARSRRSSPAATRRTSRGTSRR